MKRNIAVILAGGVGSRLGMSTPKQFFKVAGKMVAEHTVDVFERNSRIDEIAIVSNPMLIADFENIVLRNKWRKVKKILKGGKERYDSSLSAIQAYADEDVNLIFHDAVRPLLSQRTLNDVIDALHDHKAIDVAVPSADTIIEVRATTLPTYPTAHACAADRHLRRLTVSSYSRLTVKRCKTLPSRQPTTVAW